MVNIFKRKKRLHIGKTVNCVFCGIDANDIGCGHLLKDGNIVGAQFCSHSCVASATLLLKGKNGSFREWRKGDGIELWDEPFEI